MRSRLVSISIIGALILSACGGSASSTTRLRNSAANCFDTAAAQTLAVDTARSNLTTAQSALTAAGDKAALDSALAAATSDATALQAQFNAAEAAESTARSTWSALYNQGYRASMPDGPEKNTYLAALNAISDNYSAKSGLLFPLNQARQRQSAAQRAVDAWTAAESSVSQGQTALSAAEGTQLCASDEVVAADDSADDTTDAADDSADDTTDAADDSADETTNPDDTTTNEDQVDDSASQESTTGDDDGGDVNAAVEESETVCTIAILEGPGEVVVGEVFNIIAVAESSDEQQDCGADIRWFYPGANEFELGNINLEGNQATLSARSLVAGMVQIIAGTKSNGKLVRIFVNFLELVGPEEEFVDGCAGLQPEVTWNEDRNGTLLTALSCEDAAYVTLELVNERSGLLFRTTANGNTQVRSVMKGEGPFTYQAWHMCPSPTTSKIWYACGEMTVGEVPSGSPADSSGSGAAAPADEDAPPSVPVGLFAPVVNPLAGSVEGSTPPIQIAVDPAVVILVCDRDCVADVAQRAGVDVTAVGDDGGIADVLVEMRIDDGEWGVALGGFIPVDNGRVSAEFRVTPIKGEPVTFAADLYGNGAPLRETVSVDSSGDVVDSSGQAVARIPVFEVVAEEGGTPVLLIVLILLALLVAVLVAAFVMKKQRAKLAKSRNTSDSSSSV
jgi:flagellar basal body-associated protein FliL